MPHHADETPLLPDGDSSNHPPSTRASTRPRPVTAPHFHPAAPELEHEDFSDDEDNPTESTSLLPSPATASLTSDGPITLPILKAEIFALFKLSWPVSLGYIISTSLGLTQIFAVGHLGTTELAAVALTTMLCNVTGYSLGIGMANALDSLCPQAYTGDKDPHALGKHLQRGIVVMAALCVPIAVLWFNAEKLLLLMGQNEEVAALSGQLARWAFIGCFPFMVNDCMKRYLQAQGIMKATMVTALIASLINMVLQYTLVWSRFSLGVMGAPIATSITYWTLPFLTGCYIKYIDGGAAWGGLSARDAFSIPHLRQFLALGLPSVIMTCSEWWAFEIVALAAGWLGNNELAAQTIALNTCSMTYVLPMGLSIAASTRIGNALGAVAPRTAKAGAMACVVLSVMLATVNFTAIFAVRNQWGWVWSSDPEVVKLVASILPLAAVFQVSDALGAASGGILRGCGRPEIGAYINLAGYYIIGLPISFIAAFKFDLDIAGLWLGLTVAIILVSATTLFIISRLDWKVEAARAGKRIQSSHVGEPAAAVAVEE
ncbi:mate-domain-containing protein [Fimicolochytrium jonesii]|uniref:mate-domain-containing protein n=1 Tax=Fimicolochytrium jonesii TaxID=1396493 RepID=UPI0022FF3DF0|nr:mate-domain-containing protein [Fimicolochytrium jonesii]KAI8816045.1 mate-domain-containing protein [Fimicolochytrium jonesii]